MERSPQTARRNVPLPLTERLRRPAISALRLAFDTATDALTEAPLLLLAAICAFVPFLPPTLPFLAAAFAFDAARLVLAADFFLGFCAGAFFCALVFFDLAFDAAVFFFALAPLALASAFPRSSRVIDIFFSGAAPNTKTSLIFTSAMASGLVERVRRKLNAARGADGNGLFEIYLRRAARRRARGRRTRHF